MAEVIKVANIGDNDIHIHNAIIIPKGATNGDMIMTVFPDAKIQGVEGLEGFQCAAVSIGLGTSYFALDWWNAPYRR